MPENVIVALISSISGIRGTIGGKPGEGLSPVDVVNFTSAYGTWINKTEQNKIVTLGRDARPSGLMVKNLVSSTLTSMGISVIDLDFATTPTVEMAVTGSNAGGGIIITASHNPENWNALKLLNSKGQFLSPAEAAEIFSIAESGNFEYSQVNQLGSISRSEEWLNYHITKILELKLVSPEKIKASAPRIIVDVVNSVGSIAVPALLQRLGITEFKILNGEMNGHFTHNPEPLPENLGELSSEVVKGNFDLGIAVDPDVDRLSFVCEDGTFFGEEYTLVSIADYWLSHYPGNTVSNLSSSRALRDITLKHGGKYSAAAVGEINVVEEMLKTNAVVGGEGNGGVIIPDLHYGRDALAGIALFLSQMAASGKKVSEIRSQYPDYFISKNKILLDPSIDVDEVLSQFHILHKNEDINTLDGIKVDFADYWIHLRRSNTEPIIRIYSEAKSAETARNLAATTIDQIENIIKAKV